MTTTPKPPRRSRRDRPTKRAGRLTERDIELLTFVGRSRVATTEALAMAFFGDRSTCSRRLARLTGAGLLRVQVEHLNAPNLYTLSERAAEHLVAEGIDEDALHVGRFPKREALEHLRHLAELRAAFLVADSRFYVRASEAEGFAVTPLCTDLEGPAWARRAQGGWAFVTHRDRTVEPTLMLSRAPKGDTGWFAVTGLDGSTRAVALDESDSYAALAIGRHLIFVDRQNTVAGEVFAAQGAAFTTMSRTAAGVTVSRDDEGGRTVVFTESLTGAYARAVGTRPQGPAATEVFRVDLVRFLAVTPGGVELSTDRGATWQRVLERPSLTRAHLGWLPGHRLALATPDGVASETCPD